MHDAAHDLIAIDENTACCHDQGRIGKALPCDFAKALGIFERRIGVNVDEFQFEMTRIHIEQQHGDTALADIPINEFPGRRGAKYLDPSCLEQVHDSFPVLLDGQE